MKRESINDPRLSVVERISKNLADENEEIRVALAPSSECGQLASYLVPPEVGQSSKTSADFR